MTDSHRRPDQPPVDDDVEGHAAGGGSRVEPLRDENDADVSGHAFSARPETRDQDDDVEGHVYVRPEDQSRET
jgi:hypothetical protein